MVDRNFYSVLSHMSVYQIFYLLTFSCCNLVLHLFIFIIHVKLLSIPCMCWHFWCWSLQSGRTYRSQSIFLCIDYHVFEKLKTSKQFSFWYQVLTDCPYIIVMSDECDAIYDNASYHCDVLTQPDDVDAAITRTGKRSEQCQKIYKTVSDDRSSTYSEEELPLKRGWRHGLYIVLCKYFVNVWWTKRSSKYFCSWVCCVG